MRNPARRNGRSRAQEIGNGGETHQAATSIGQSLISNQGVQVSDNQSSWRLEARGRNLSERHVEEKENEMFRVAEKLADARLRPLGEQMESGTLTDGPSRGGTKNALAPPQQSAQPHSARHI